MAEKRYYWLKLKEDFFEDKQIKYLRSLPDGDKLVIAYLKMQLKSLKTEGFIKYDSVLPSNIEELSMILDEDVNIVTLMVKALQQVKAVEILDDGSFYMIAMQNLIGKDGESTERVRKFRERQAKREQIDLKYVKKINYEQIALPDGTTKIIDNKRYGGNAEYVYDLAECKCEICGESNSKKLVIHHNNGYSNDLEDLYLLCKSCHGKVECGTLKLNGHNRRSVTCNADVTNCNTEIEKEKDIEIEIDNSSNNNKEKFKTEFFQNFYENVQEDLKRLHSKE